MNEITPGAIVFHPLFSGPGVVSEITLSDKGTPIAKVLWQSVSAFAFHKVASLSFNPVARHPDLR